MSTYLVALALGPVQSLIEAARRTRDLWCGSWLLSECARAAALELHRAHRHCLIFPYLADPDEDLKPKASPGEEANIANILRAEIAAGSADEIRALCERAGKAAGKRLRGLCDEARRGLKGLPIHQDLWEAQVEDILECYAAWTLVKDGDYGAAAERLDGLLAARKATRNFEPAAEGPNGSGYGIPKSSLDAARESVIAVHRRDRDASQYRTALRQLALAPGEELDALGLAKRRAGDADRFADRFTAYSRIAADTWIESLTPDWQARIRDAYDPLVGLELATRVRGNLDPRTGRSIYDALPYDAQLLYGFRLGNALHAKGLSSEEEGALRRLQRVLQDLAEEPAAAGRTVGVPVPYAAILKADGDHMGDLLRKARTADHSREISKCLHRFACQVRDIVRRHRGHAIYSGGDDVLALLPLGVGVDRSSGPDALAPLPGALAAARDLERTFASELYEIAARLGLDPDKRPTLSVGIGIGHIMEPLGRLRDRADRAEKRAKGNDLEKDLRRNALAILVGIRSGAEYGWRARWSDKDAHLDLDRYIRAFQQGELPSRVPYDLGAIARRLARLDDWAAPGTDAERAARRETVGGIRRSEVLRLLERARVGAGSDLIPPDLRRLIARRAAEPQRAAEQPLDALAQTLIVARWLSARIAADLGDRQ